MFLHYYKGIKTELFLQTPLHSIQSESKNKITCQKWKEFKEGYGNCLVCDRPVLISDKTKYVHLFNTLQLVNSNEDFVESQGYYPIGNDCAKLLPCKSFIFKRVNDLSK